MLVGYRQRTKSGVWDALVRSARLAREEREAHAAAQETLDFVGLSDPAGRLARDLTQEQQKRLAMALAIVARPRLLLLDEPSAGINAEQTRGLIALIEKIAATGVTVCLIEHQMQMVMHLCRRIMVLDYGKKIADGHAGRDPHRPRRARSLPGSQVTLQVSNLTVSYGSFQAARQINLEVREGELVVLLGANGAGKTTVFRALSGLTPRRRRQPHRVCRPRSVERHPARHRRCRDVALPGGPQAVPGAVGADQPAAGRVSLPRPR